jgi:flagellar protein FliO/FliZ
MSRILHPRMALQTPVRCASAAAAWARRLAPAALLLAHAAAQAQAATKPLEGPSFTPMVLALVFVLGLMGAAVWILRRTGLAPRTGTSHLKVVSQLALGPRERVVIVEAGDRWLLLGVGAGGISRLGTLPKSASADAEAPAASFGALLGKLRGGTQ